MTAASGGGTPHPGSAAIEIRGLTKVFGSGETAVRALDGIDLQIERGEMVAIMGPSGSADAASTASTTAS